MTATIDTQTTTAGVKPAPIARNGVDTPKLFDTINLVKGMPDLAKFQFRAAGQWQGGTHSRSTMSGFYGAGSEQSHPSAFTADADHPSVLCGGDAGPTPVEYLLHALSACLTAGIANIASARGVDLGSVEADVTGDIDLRGILGLSDEVRNGYQGIKVTFRVKGDADAETLSKIVEQSRARSAVYDVLTNGVPISIDVKTGA